MAQDTRMHDLDHVSNGVDKLKQFISNFVDRRPSVPGGRPLLNTAIDADDGNPVLRERARRGLHEWRGRLRSIVSTGMKRGEIRRDVDAREVATLIMAALEGALVIGRAATGLEKGGTYRHFSCKEALAAEAFDYAWKATRTSGSPGGRSITSGTLPRYRSSTNRLRKVLCHPRGASL